MNRRPNEGNITFAHAISTMMVSWLVGFGAPAIALLVSKWLSPIALPFAVFILGALLIRVNVGFYRSPFGGLQLVVRNSGLALIISSLVMLVINLMNTKYFVNYFAGDSYNPAIPYIPSLVIYSVMIVVFAASWLSMREGGRVARRWRTHVGSDMHEGLVMALYQHEMRVQTRMVTLLSLLILAIEWPFYFKFYININVNEADTFFFFILPLSVCVVSIVYMISRYSNMRFEVRTMGMRDQQSHTSKVRFMVVRGDRMLLVEQPVGQPGGRILWDTPAIVKLPNNIEPSVAEVHKMFEKLAGTKDFRVRYLFTTQYIAMNTSAFHYAVFLPDDAELSGVQGTWMSLYDINMLLNGGDLVRAFAYEIHRIYTVTMAWKTYDRDGRRIYPIKNYKPTFRISDFKDWDVDYDDQHWINVANNNEDRPLWRLRRFWRRYIWGTDRKWKETQ